MDNKIKLQHGDGGKLTNELIENLFYKNFGNSILLKGLDSGLFPIEKGKMAFTTDSFVVKPIFFRGGDIGKLAICGTINDLVVSGAKPLYLSTAFIIEEGFSMESLKKIVNSMVDTCNNTGVKIVTGDTKVVPKGSVDGLYINTSGIGIVEKEFNMGDIEEDDEILITGTIGEHGTSIAIDRYELSVQGNIESDCAPLNKILENLEEYLPYIKLMKDPTRGGLGTILNEISKFSSLSIHIFEDKIPIKREVKGVCDILGLDPMYIACEGRMVMVVKKQYAKKVLEKLRILEEGKDAEIIGHFTCENTRTVYMENSFGGLRIINTLENSMIPRIC